LKVPQKISKYDYPVVARSAASVYGQRNSFMDIRANPNRGLIKTLLFLREISICVFFAVAVSAARKINTELFELSGLPEKPG